MKCCLYDRSCINCGECDLCDIVEGKICDNCGKCIECDREYSSIKIDEIIMPIERKKKNNEK